TAGDRGQGEGEQTQNKDEETTRESCSFHEATPSPLGILAPRCSHLIGINPQRAQFLSQGLGPSLCGFLSGEPHLTVSVIEAQELLIWNQEAVEFATPQGAP